MGLNKRPFGVHFLFFLGFLSKSKLNVSLQGKLRTLFSCFRVGGGMWEALVVPDLCVFFGRFCKALGGF